MHILIECVMTDGQREYGITNQAVSTRPKKSWKNDFENAYIEMFNPCIPDWQTYEQEYVAVNIVKCMSDYRRGLDW
jgi:hypothetical protein